MNGYYIPGLILLASLFIAWLLVKAASDDNEPEA